MKSQVYPIRTPIFQPSVGTSSFSSSGASPDRDSIEDYIEIGGSISWNPVVEAHCISMVGSARAPSHNSSSRCPTIRGFEASDAWTPNNIIIQNLNLGFNAIWLQTIMDSIQCMVPQDSPIVVLAQQGAEAVGQIIAIEASAGNQRGEPSIGKQSVIGNKCMTDNDRRRRITQNHRQCEYGHDPADLCNVIDDRRCLMARTPSPPQYSPV
jgi:hypothetical protein